MKTYLRRVEPKPQPFKVRRRTFLAALFGGAALYSTVGCGGSETKPNPVPTPEGVSIPEVKEGEDIFAYVTRIKGKFDQVFYQQVVGASNEFKEGDMALGVAAADQTSRDNARKLMSNTKVADLDAHPLLADPLYTFIEDAVDTTAESNISGMTMGELKDFVLTKSEADIKAMMIGLGSELIGCLVKLMSNAELISIGQKVFNPLPGSQIGAQGYMGARIQPNSPTDNIDDIRWQVFDAWSYAVGDVVLGTNPVSSEVDSVASVENALKDILEAFGIQDVIPHCVLAHIDVQAAVEQKYPGSTALWFQSLGGTESANQTFDVSIQGMADHAKSRSGKYGLYFETGQGADATNGHGLGFDMVVHESRKYGFARRLKQLVAEAQQTAGQTVAPWVHLNDVAGFIGPEIFRNRDQLVRCCLEDIVMGKLHGLPIGLDICSTLHMEVNLDDLDWCIEQIMPANPAYLMGLPTKNDPMLSYLTTAYQDHVRVRSKFGYKVNDAMWSFFQTLGVIDAQGNPTSHFGDPTWVYLQYMRKKGDMRMDAEIMTEGQVLMDEVRKRGVPLATGYGANPWDMDPALDKQIRDLYEDAKVSIWAELDPKFVATIPSMVEVATSSKDREDYILHPPNGEVIAADSQSVIDSLKSKHGDQYDVQIVISDGLNARALMDDGHLLPFLDTLRQEFTKLGYRVAPEHIVVTAGRVRAGYRIGEELFAELPDANSHRAVVHVIGERPGSGHHNFSAYLTAQPVNVWAQRKVDHDITKVVSGISDTALDPRQAAKDAVSIIQQMAPPPV